MRSRTLDIRIKIVGLLVIFILLFIGFVFLWLFPRTQRAVMTQTQAQLHPVIQQTAANAEKRANAAEEFTAQSEEMREVLGELVVLRGGGDSGTTKEARPAVSALAAGFKTYLATTHAPRGPAKSRQFQETLLPSRSSPWRKIILRILDNQHYQSRRHASRSVLYLVSSLIKEEKINV